MAASDYDFILTRNEIIRIAYKKVIAFDDEDTLSGNQVNDAVKYLGMILASWESDGIKLFQRYEHSFPTVASTPDYAAPTDPPIVGIFSCVYEDSTRDISLTVIPYNEYLQIDYKELSGKPQEIAYDTVGKKFYIYPTPNEIFTVKPYVVQKIKDFDTAGGSSNITANFQRALVYELALELAPDYGLSIEERDALEKQRNVYLKKAKKGDIELGTRKRCRGYA